MKPEHARLLADLRREARPTSPERHQNNDSYGGSGHPFYYVSAPALRAIAKHWLAEQKAMPHEAFLAVVESLFAGKSHEEKTLAALLVGYHAKARLSMRPEDVDRWLGHLNGWAEIDALCQNAFTAADMAADWPGWKRLIEQLSRDPNINKRRAALVLLNGPVHYTGEARFRDLALATIERLKAERDILITKAVSWSLRSMTKQHREAVAAYLAEHGASLPKVAVRETKAKLETGVKSGRRKVPTG